MDATHETSTAGFWFLALVAFAVLVHLGVA